MACLGIDTSGGTLSVGISTGGKILAERTTHGNQSHSVVILSEIEALLDESGVSRSQVTLISVTGGPGRYTALRVGMATAKGLAFAWNVPLVRVSTLEAMAASLLPIEGPVATILDARRRLVYFALFEARRGELTRLSEDQALAYDDAAALLPDSVLLTGDGSDLVTPYALEKGVTFAARQCMIKGSIVARIGKAAYGSHGINEILEGPTYIRKVEIHGHGFHDNPNG